MKKIGVIKQKGQALVIIAVAMIGLLAIGALSVDASLVMFSRRNAQGAADAAVLAGAYYLTQGMSDSQAQTYALLAAHDNGFDTADPHVIEVTYEHPPTSGPYAGDDEYVKVIIKHEITTTLGSFLFGSTSEDVVEATAQYATSSGGLFGGYGMMAVGDSGQGITVTGNSRIYVYGAGIFTNSSSSNAVYLSGSGEIHTDGELAAVGDCNPAGNPRVYSIDTDPGGWAKCWWPVDFTIPNCAGHASNASVISEVFAVPVPSTTLVGTITETIYNNHPVYGGWKRDKIVTPGIHTGNTTFDACNVVTLQPGIHYFEGKLTITSDAIVNGDKVLIVANDDVTIDGNTDTYLTAMDTGDWAGIIIFGTSNMDSFTDTASGELYYSGTLFAPYAHCTVSGHGDVVTQADAMPSQIICDSIQVDGSGIFTLDANPDYTYNNSNPRIELSQ